MTSTVLLVMDVQQGIVERFGGEEGYLPRLAAADVVRIADWTAGLQAARPVAG